MAAEGNSELDGIERFQYFFRYAACQTHDYAFFSFKLTVLLTIRLVFYYDITGSSKISEITAKM